jgi:peptidyl-prolyl cis-trans isomerase B (cyclophilin B)
MNKRHGFWIAVCLVCFFVCCKKQPEATYEVAQIKTRLGEILFWLYDETPRHKASFIQLARDGYWDTLTFNRVIPNFVAQGGCPDTEAGFTDTAYLLKPEFVPTIRHIYGAVGAGRDNNPEMLSARCQFYIVQNQKGEARLDDKFTVFGQVFKGMEVVDSIVAVATDTIDAPLQPIPLDIQMIRLTAKELEAAGYKIKSN